MAFVLPRTESMLQMTSRVQRLGPNLLLQVPAEALHHLLRLPPHPLAPDFRIPDAVHCRRVQFVRIGVQERRSHFFDFLVAEDVFAVVIFRVVLDQSGCLELVVVDLRVA